MEDRKQEYQTLADYLKASQKELQILTALQSSGLDIKAAKGVESRRFVTPDYSAATAWQLTETDNAAPYLKRKDKCPGGLSFGHENEIFLDFMAIVPAPNKTTVTVFCGYSPLKVSKTIGTVDLTFRGITSSELSGPYESDSIGWYKLKGEGREREGRYREYFPESSIESLKGKGVQEAVLEQVKAELDFLRSVEQEGLVNHLDCPNPFYKSQSYNRVKNHKGWVSLKQGGIKL